MYEQVYDPVGDSLLASSAVAAIPILALFLLLGGLKLKAHVAALISLVIALAVAVIVYGMPIGQSLDAGLEGAVFGLFPIMWIVWNALWIFHMTEATGHFAVLRRSIAAISDDQRVQAVIIAFCFGALLEALAGFGTPVAITSVLLVGAGYKPMKAAAVALVANTAPVAFGALAIPIITLAEITGLPKDDLGAMVGRQTPILALFVPLILIGMVDGARGIRQTWPAAVVGGVVFGAAQFACSNYLSVELTDIVASLLGIGAVVALLRVWQPSEPLQGRGGRHGPAGDRRRRRDRPAVRGRGAPAGGRRARLAARRRCSRTRRTSSSSRSSRSRSGPRSRTSSRRARRSSTGPAWTSSTIRARRRPARSSRSTGPPRPGRCCSSPACITMAALRVSPGRSLRIYVDTLKQLKWATVTVATVLALAYVMNLSGQTITIGRWLAGAGGLLGILSPIIGWLGVAVTGSDTSSNSLFGALQVSAAKDAGISEVLLAAANSSGGVLGKMISPQNLAIGAAAVGLGGQEGEVLRKVVGWSLALLAVMCAIVYLQTTDVLGWMVVK